MPTRNHRNKKLKGKGKKSNASRRAKRRGAKARKPIKTNPTTSGIVKNHYLSGNRKMAGPPRPVDPSKKRVRGIIAAGTYGDVYVPPMEVIPFVEELERFPSRGIYFQGRHHTHGDIIEPGTYPLVERNWADEGFISKVFRYTRDGAYVDEIKEEKQHAINSMKEEVAENDKIDRLDPTFEWHLESVPNMLAIGEKEDGVVKFHADAFDRPCIQYMNGGKSLDKIAEDAIGEASIPKLRRLCLALDRLGNVNMNHLDIKLANVVYSGDRDEFNLIDYGLASDSKDISSNRAFLFEASYFVYPIEFEHISPSSVERYQPNFGHTYGSKSVGNIYIQYADSDIDSDSDSDSDWYEQYNRLWVKRPFSTFEEGEHRRIYGDNHKYIKDLVREDNIDEAMRVIDVFGLGIVFGELYKRIYGEKITVPKEYALDGEMPAPEGGDMKSRFKHLICRMCNPRARRRIKNTELLAEFDALITPRPSTPTPRTPTPRTPTPRTPTPRTPTPRTLTPCTPTPCTPTPCTPTPRTPTPPAPTPAPAAAPHAPNTATRQRRRQRRNRRASRRASRASRTNIRQPRRLSTQVRRR
jgi:serine/threonine protein kinase